MPPGFLGTGASLLADLTLLAYILLIVPGMVGGWVLARMGRHRPGHKWLMIGVTLANWILILLLMVAAYFFDVAGNIGSQPANPRYLMPTIHAVLGLPAQLLATYICYRMLKEDYQVARAAKRRERNTSKYWFRQAKWTMQVTLALWLIVSVLGVVNYVVRYNVLPGSAARNEPPAATEEPAPAATPEPAATDDPVPAATEEVAVTPEATP
jgi:uncharacterized membrane protein YozB (DUF420 family)